MAWRGVAGVGWGREGCSHVLVYNGDGSEVEELGKGALGAGILALGGEALRGDEHLGACLHAWGLFGTAPWQGGSNNALPPAIPSSAAGQGHCAWSENG